VSCMRLWIRPVWARCRHAILGRGGRWRSKVWYQRRFWLEKETHTPGDRMQFLVGRYGKDWAIVRSGLGRSSGEDSGGDWKGCFNGDVSSGLLEKRDARGRVSAGRPFEHVGRELRAAGRSPTFVTEAQPRLRPSG
jgi:hypothetical protein